MNATGPLFKWFGSKWLSAKTLPQPLYDTILEPFAGSASYSLRHASSDVAIAELDPHINLLWNWLIKEATESAIREIPIDVKEGTDIRELGLSVGQATLLKSWQRTNNVGDCWTISPWGNKPGQWTANTRARVAEEFQVVRHWNIIADAFELLTIPRMATWFVDPPYFYNYQYRRSTRLDYSRLAQLCKGLSGQVIVCEAACQKTRVAPDWLPFVPFASRITSRRKANENHHSREYCYHHVSEIDKPVPDYEVCGECGFDHEYEPAESRAFHQK